MLLNLLLVIEVIVALFLVVSGGMLYAFTHLKEPRT